jgi:carboxymethylenebutenolidase
VPETSVPLTPSGVQPAYVASPVDHGHAGAGPFPGVVVIHDALGMKDDTRRWVDWLAAQGFLAIAPDLFAHGTKIGCLISTFRDLQRRSGRAFERAEATREFLAARAGAVGHLQQGAGPQAQGGGHVRRRQ